MRTVKNILIVGSKGFIGSRAVALLGEQYQVWGCDVLNNDYQTERYFWIDGMTTGYEEVFRTVQFDACINCSGSASVPYSIQYPAKDYALNVALVSKLLEVIRTLQPNCIFIHLSSAAVYGNTSQLPIAEDAPLNPLSPYGLHKKQAEEIVRMYSEHYGIKACSVRIFSVFGPGLRRQFFGDLQQKLKQSSHIQLWGTGEESRDFIYVDDVVKAIEAVLLKSTLTGESINIASGIETTIREAVELFKQVYPQPFTYEFAGSAVDGFVERSVADVSVLRAMIYNLSSLALNIRKFVC